MYEQLKAQLWNNARNLWCFLCATLSTPLILVTSGRVCSCERGFDLEDCQAFLRFELLQVRSWSVVGPALQTRTCCNLSLLSHYCDNSEVPASTLTPTRCYIAHLFYNDIKDDSSFVCCKIN